MQITYFSNSGFAFEKDGDILVFDCYDPKMQPLLKEQALSVMKNITVFISHGHGDHYSPDIFAIKNADFVLSYDVSFPKQFISRSTVMRPGDAATVGEADIKAFGSTDEGVSFFVQWKGITIFHAGDLNDWHWKDEGGEEYARRAEEQFLHELRRIEAEVKSIDFAFFPVDPRMGSEYYKGAVLFAKAMRPKYFIPMHFGKRFEPPAEFFEEIATYTELLAPIEQGRSIKITL